MKKLFTLVALLACFLGAKADWVTDYSIDYSSNTSFPFYVMGYVPEWVDGNMVDYGADFRYATQDVLDNGDSNGNGKLADGESVQGSAMAGNTEYQKVTGAGPYWHQYFIADNIPTEVGGSYTVKALVKSTETVNINVNMGWGWGDGQQAGVSVSIPQSDDFVEVEWNYSDIDGSSCNLVAQPGTATATITWKSLTVSHNQKEGRPVTYQEWLTSDGQPVVVQTTPAAIPTWMGNAETPWADSNVKFNDQDNNWKICAWSKEKGHNMNENEGWDPFPAGIEEDPGDPSNHVFVCHGQPATTEGDASAWDNQFWIESPKQWKAGEQVVFRFRYKASKNVTTGTQIHHQNPSDYMTWQGVGDVSFTTEWQDFEKTYSWPSDGARTDDTGWSLCFNLNSTDKDAIDFYFDDLSWQTMVLDEGFFVAGCNTDTGLEYDYDNAIQFVDEDQNGEFEATIGELGNPATYVSQIMISTVRGHDASFKSNTLKPKYAVTNDPNDWNDYEAGSNAKINLPGAGVWKILIDPGYNAMSFEMLEGTTKNPLPEIPNETEVVVNGQERDDLSDTAQGDNPQREEEGGTGETWDNQFFIKANRALAKGEVTILKFKYKASKDAKTTTQCHGATPGSYMHWAAIGDVNFTTEWQDFEQTFTIPNEADGMQIIAFNMAEIKEACEYHLKDFVWMTQDMMETLINTTGYENFYVKEGAGTDPYVFTDIVSIVNENKNSNVKYNLAGQRVSKDYKGIVITNGKKAVIK